mgnify:CR=1 FL=1
MTLLLQITGVLLIFLGLAHSLFNRHFNWIAELKKVNLITRQVFHVHHFFVALTVTLMGILCLIYPEDLQTTPLGRAICLGLGFFWLCRLFIQFFGYSSELWKGRTFETVVHCLFGLLWLSLTVLFTMVGLGVTF